MLTYQETPIQEIYDHKISTAGLRLLIKREDLNHPYVSGNKWWKLKYNLEEASRQQRKILLTYGGAYSNHIYATAAAANEIKLKSVGLIRGEETFPLNATLSFAKEKGMELKYIPRAVYRAKEKHAQYLSQFKDYYAIPEGGSNFFAVKGISEFAKKLGEEFDCLCCPVGTGGTLAGLISALDDSKKIVGFPVIKGAHFLVDEITNLIEDKNKSTNWRLVYDYHFGGYAKATPELLQFIDVFTSSHNIPLEFIYTGKMMAGIYDLISKGFFRRGATILAIHTGGLQGKQFK